jgi:hypothetical protein
MKGILATFTLSALLLTACGGAGGPISVADPQEVADYPELRELMRTWETMITASEKEDCETILEHMRVLTKTTADDCPAIFEYMADAPIVDWGESQWAETGSKVKIYELESGSIANFIKDGRTEVWGADNRFWE